MPNPRSSKESTAPESQETSIVLSIILIVFESLLTFLLRHHAPSQRLAERLVADHAVIRIRTHLPAHIFYATFSHHGVLLDEQAPDQPYLATVDGSVPSLFRAFMTAPPQILDSILIHGDEELVSELRELMQAFHLSNILSSWVGFPWFGKHRTAATAAQPAYKQQRIKPLLKRIDEQKKQIEQCQVTIKQQAHQLQHLQSRQMLVIWAALGSVTVLLMIIAFLFFR